MTTDPLLQSLPLLLETKPELFSTDDLQDLQQTLARLENNSSENPDPTLIDWCRHKERVPIKNALRSLAIRRKELDDVPPFPASQSASSTDFKQELSQKVKEKLSERTDSSKSDSAKLDQNQKQ
ncbi:hypothetical protein [Okeania sp. SIO2C2]|uniref:hypothetical protein n=1 Tax=Okeania sp. SIO2C2 TaxID=2607787 RepID=UPI00257D5663|nr:hypothetical protein [Okeania sp. SIO2C2]